MRRGVKVRLGVDELIGTGGDELGGTGGDELIGTGGGGRGGESSSKRSLEFMIQFMIVF
jgi:hypothetical protein